MNSRLSLVTGKETEVKFRLTEATEFRRRLRSLGYRVRRRKVFERNTILDTEPLSLRPQGCLLRVREAGGKTILTFKGKATVSKVKSREEIEYEASESAAAFLLLERLGYRKTFIYEKYRTEYHHPDGGGIVTLDETPIGNYAELEGDEDWIEKAAGALGYADEDYITASYGALYNDWCARRGLEPEHMVFVR